MFMKEMELLNKNELVYKDEMGINWVLYCIWYVDFFVVMVVFCFRVVLVVVMDVVRVILLGGFFIINLLLGVFIESYIFIYRLWFI